MMALSEPTGEPTIDPEKLSHSGLVRYRVGGELQDGQYHPVLSPDQAGKFDLFNSDGTQAVAGVAVSDFAPSVETLEAYGLFTYQGDDEGLKGGEYFLVASPKDGKTQPGKFDLYDGTYERVMTGIDGSDIGPSRENLAGCSTAIYMGTGPLQGTSYIVYPQGPGFGLYDSNGIRVMKAAERKDLQFPSDSI
jgi:hypothetical protein